MQDIRGLSLRKLRAAADDLTDPVSRELLVNAIEEIMDGRVVLVPLEPGFKANVVSGLIVPVGAVKGVLSCQPFTIHDEEADRGWSVRALSYAERLLKDGGPPPNELCDEAIDSYVHTMAVLVIGQTKEGGAIYDFGHHPLFTSEAAQSLMCKQLEKLREEQKALN